MSKYILITATDWDIYTDKFDTFDDARSKMMGELKKELVRSGAMYELTEVVTEGDFDDDYEGWDMIKDLEEYWGREISEYGFDFHKDYARCDTDGDNPLKWRIIDVQ